MKKTAIFLIGLLFPFITCAQGYSDVPSYYKYFNAINSLSDSDVIGGYDDGNFRPDNTINRAELIKSITVFALSEGEIDQCIAENFGKTFFSDVPADSWYAKYVCAAKTAGIIDGYPDGTFRPSDPINFAEALKMILDSREIQVNRVRVIQNPLLYISNTDWYSKYFSYAYNKNLINRNKFYHPAQLITRGEAAEIIYRMDYMTQNETDEYDKPETQNSDEYTITIPKLNIINTKVSFANPYDSNEALEVLKSGLGQYLAAPGDGKKMVIFGHSSGYSWDKSAYKTVLRQINKLENGDKIYLNYHEKGYIYQIYNQEIMPAKQLPAIMKDYGYEELALYTCWPPESIKDRYVIYATPENL